MTQAKQSLALVIYDQGGRLLVVKRPPDESDELAGIWGLPAGSPAAGESLEDCALRVGREKLGVELDAFERLHAGEAQRAAYCLHLTLVGARVAAGEVRLLPPPPGDGRTFYAELAWTAEPGPRLRPGAELGSLCCRLYLELPQASGG